MHGLHLLSSQTIYLGPNLNFSPTLYLLSTLYPLHILFPTNLSVFDLSTSLFYGLVLMISLLTPFFTSYPDRTYILPLINSPPYSLPSHLPTLLSSFPVLQRSCFLVLPASPRRCTPRPLASSPPSSTPLPAFPAPPHASPPRFPRLVCSGGAAREPRPD